MFLGLIGVIADPTTAGSEVSERALGTKYPIRAMGSDPSGATVEAKNR